MQAAAIGLEEVRIYGLNKTITTEALGEFLGKSVRLRGILLHSQTKGAFQWAQVWVSTEAEVARLLRLREAFAANGITISRVGTGPSTTPSPLADTWDFVSQLSRPRVAPPGFGISLAQPSPFNPTDNTSSQPRNLYVLNLPLNLTHGFVLMSTHHEAIEAMRQMNGKWIDGSKLDVSWALVQREAKNMLNSSLPNRVAHPPTVSNRHEPQPESTVLVENLVGISIRD
ncbi:hypothetical protein CC85DRAFT_314297 [Cutaneotrichosporon oleaginosum]|uniref:RRM domain-containing protein n=1 Tax=Cutaneotrichosporon oleaginosum TaxID=879819 RepID=A0A0J0XC74_9TREE|nr:uncharacterized protein CC85DRAFT_314297 [Cutaneotrichosporon oleaginosum]KLT38673.1 hypothetical protein CC85DRAFT_314297 [Cutaneotrichosporon oleaginosum]TXT12280.1 hypothetical protein COLE_02690 [Cutaneotrichosporon oleaginosum]